MFTPHRFLCISCHQSGSTHAAEFNRLVPTSQGYMHRICQANQEARPRINTAPSEAHLMEVASALSNNQHQINWLNAVDASTTNIDQIDPPEQIEERPSRRVSSRSTGYSGIDRSGHYQPPRRHLSDLPEELLGSIYTLAHGDVEAPAQHHIPASHTKPQPARQVSYEHFIAGTRRLSKFSGRDRDERSSTRTRASGPYRPNTQNARIVLGQGTLRPRLAREPFLIIGPTIFIQHGHEAEALLPALRQNPQQKTFIRFINANGRPSQAQDANGPTWQAHEQAFHQLLAMKDLFVEDSGSKKLKQDAQSINHEKCFDLGLLLGRISQLNMVIGHPLKPDFYEKIVSAFAMLKEENISEQVKPSDLEKFFDKASFDKAISLLQRFDSQAYSSQDALDTLKELHELEPVQQTAKASVLPYMLIGLGIKATGLQALPSATEFQKSICGVQNLQKTFVENIKLMTPMSLDRVQAVKAEAAVKNIIQGLKDSEALHLCRKLTSSSSLIDKEQLSFKVTNVPSNSVFSFHNCFKSFDLSLASLKSSAVVLGIQKESDDLNFDKPEIQNLMKDELLGSQSLEYSAR